MKASYHKHYTRIEKLLQYYQKNKWILNIFTHRKQIGESLMDASKMPRPVQDKLLYQYYTK